MASLLREVKFPDNGQFRVRLIWTSIDPMDAQLAKKYGEPKIALGGTFTDPADATFTWQEPEQYTVLFNFGPALEKAYDSTQDPLAEKRASIWDLIMKKRINDALTALRAKTDTYSTDQQVSF
jgi:hypothetical protein